MLFGLKGAVTTITSPGPTKDMVACFAMFYGKQPPACRPPLMPARCRLPHHQPVSWSDLISILKRNILKFMTAAIPRLIDADGSRGLERGACNPPT